MMADMNNDILKVLITEEELKNKVQELGAAISRDYEGKNLLMVSVLKGSVIFMADLMRAITIPAQIDFMSVSSYGAGVKSSGVVKILKDLDALLEGKDLLLVEEYPGQRPHSLLPAGDFDQAQSRQYKNCHPAG